MDTKLAIIGLGVAIAFVLLMLLRIWQNSRTAAGRTPESILEEVDVLLVYDAKRQAIELLRQARLEHPDDDRIRHKLAELDPGPGR